MKRSLCCGARDERTAQLQSRDPFATSRRAGVAPSYIWRRNSVVQYSSRYKVSSPPYEPIPPPPYEPIPPYDATTVLDSTPLLPPPVWCRWLLSRSRTRSSSCAAAGRSSICSRCLPAPHNRRARGPACAVCGCAVCCRDCVVDVSQLLLFYINHYTYTMHGTRSFRSRIS